MVQFLAHMSWFLPALMWLSCCNLIANLSSASLSVLFIFGTRNCLLDAFWNEKPVPEIDINSCTHRALLKQLLCVCIVPVCLAVSVYISVCVSLCALQSILNILMTAALTEELPKVCLQCQHWHI